MDVIQDINMEDIHSEDELDVAGASSTTATQDLRRVALEKVGQVNRWDGLELGTSRCLQSSAVEEAEDHLLKAQEVGHRTTFVPGKNLQRPISSHQEIGSNFVFQPCIKPVPCSQSTYGRSLPRSVILQGEQSSIPLQNLKAANYTPMPETAQRAQGIPHEHTPELKPDGVLNNRSGPCSEGMEQQQPSQDHKEQIPQTALHSTSRSRTPVAQTLEAGAAADDTSVSAISKLQSSNSECSPAEDPESLRLVVQDTPTLEQAPIESMAHSASNLTGNIAVSGAKTVEQLKVRSRPFEGINGSFPFQSVSPARHSTPEGRNIAPPKSRVDKKHRALKTPHCRESAIAGPSQQELLSLMMFRAQQEKGERDKLKACQEAQATELQDFRRAYGRIEITLKDTRTREIALETEVQRYRAAIPKWKAKVGQFDAYLKGLSNDHTKMREDSLAIVREQKSLHGDKLAFQDLIKECYDKMNAHKAASQSLTTARCHIIDLETKVVAQESRIQESTKNEIIERQQSDRLAGEMAEIAASIRQLAQWKSTRDTAIIDRLNELLESSKERQDDVTLANHSNVERCLVILAEMQGSLRSQDSEQSMKLDEILTAHVHSVVSKIQTCSTDIRSVQADQQMFKSQLGTVLGDLRSELNTEHDLTRRLDEVGQSKLEVEKCLEISKVEVGRYQASVQELKTSESINFQTIADLRSEISKSRQEAVVAPDFGRLLEESNLSNEALRIKLSESQDALKRSTESVRSREDELVEMRSKTDEVVSQLEDVKLEASNLLQAKKTFEADAATRYESMKSQLQRAARAERDLLGSGHAEALLEIRRQKEFAESRVIQAKVDFNELRDARNFASDQSVQLRSDLSKAVAQNVEKTDTIEEKNNAIQELEAKLHQAEEVLQSKDASMQAIREETSEEGRKQVELRQQLSAMAEADRARAEGMLAQLNQICQQRESHQDAHVDIAEALSCLARNTDQTQQGRSNSPELGDDDQVQSQDVDPFDLRTQRIDSFPSSQFDALETQVDAINPSQLDNTDLGESFSLETKDSEVDLLQHQDLQNELRLIANARQPALPSCGPDNLFASIQTPEKAKRKADRGTPVVIKAPAPIEPLIVVEESQVQETIVRACRSRTISRGRDSVSGTPNTTPKQKQRSSYFEGPFKYPHDSRPVMSSQGTPQKEYQKFFPPTPRDGLSGQLEPSSQQLISSQAGAGQHQLSPKSPKKVRKDVIDDSQSQGLSRPPGTPISGASRHFSQRGSATKPKTGTELPQVKLKSILKEPTTNKRSAQRAELASETQIELKKRVSHFERQGLGPVLPDALPSSGVSSIPRVGRNNRNKRRTSQTDKYTRRFSQESS